MRSILFVISRNNNNNNNNNRRTHSSKYIGYGVYFYFPGLSLRRTTTAAAYRFHSSCFIKQNHVFHLELIDSKVQSSEIIIREKDVSESVVGKDSYQSWFQSTFGYDWLLLLLKLRRTNKSSE
jgi:hypothetical protein